MSIAGCSAPPPWVELSCGTLDPGIEVKCPPEPTAALEGPLPLDGAVHGVSCASQGAQARASGTCAAEGGDGALSLHGEAYYPCDSNVFVRPTASLRATLGPGRYRVSLSAGEGTFGTCKVALLPAGAALSPAMGGEIPADPLAPGPGLTSVFDQAVAGDAALDVRLDCTEGLPIGSCFGAQGVVLGLTHKEAQADLRLHVEPEAP